MNKKKTTTDIQKDTKEPTSETKKTKDIDDQLENIPEEIHDFVKDAPPSVRRSFMAMLHI